MRRYQMPLSEYEQRVLEQMERQLSSDDPKLVHALQGAPTGVRRWLLTGAGALAGSGVLACSPPRRRGPAGAVQPDGSVRRKKSSGGFLERMEHRWDRRRDQGDR